MSDITRLCIMCAVSSVCVTLTVCAVICILTLIGNMWEVFRKFCHWTVRQIRDEMHRVDIQEADEERHKIRITKKFRGNEKNVHRS